MVDKTRDKKRDKAIREWEKRECGGRGGGNGKTEGVKRRYGAMKRGNEDCWALKRRTGTDEEFHF